MANGGSIEDSIAHHGDAFEILKWEVEANHLVDGRGVAVTETSVSRGRNGGMGSQRVGPGAAN